jgi:enoyl-CoA hydratase
MDDIKVERDGAVATVVIDRPERRNALSDELLVELATLIARLDDDADVRCLVLAGSERVFASGADIDALLRKDHVSVYVGERAACWARLRRIATPLVAAVSGACLGGGFELALYADVIVASDIAVFGLPETGLGLIPGAGATQLLPRAVGKARAMDMILTGRTLDAPEAERAGLVSRIASVAAYRAEAHEVAQEIAARPALAQALAKEAVGAAFEVGLEAGIGLERRAFSMAFATDEARESLEAFVARRRASLA